MDESAPKYRHLESQEVIETVRILRERVEARFPGSGLGKLVEELQRVAQETAARSEWIQQPHLLLRCASWLLTLAIIALLAWLLLHLRGFQVPEFNEFIQTLEASISSIIFIGAAILFLASWENRIKRTRALKAVHELRAMAHIVDMHQLTKYPESCFARSQTTTVPVKRALTPFELNRYLDYCSESLALISKIAALYVQGFQDTVLLDAVDDVEDLTAGLSRKIWQKITILENLGRALPAEE
jgi:hypothetical protein